MSAQSEQSDVEWLLEQLAPPATHDPLWHRYRAIADSIERRDAEIARLKQSQSDIPPAGFQHKYWCALYTTDPAEGRNCDCGLAEFAAAMEQKDAALVKMRAAFATSSTDNENRLRAENAALAKLADELSVDHRDDDTFDAGVRYALFILGFEKEAVEANDASKALRAGQQKG